MASRKEKLKNSEKSLTLGIISRAHSPDSTNRIYADKIQHRPLFLRPSSPPAFDAREARRKARREKEERRAKALKPKPLSARQRRSLGLYDVPKDGQRYAVFESLNRLWQGYMRELLGRELYAGGQGAAAKLSAADYHGAAVEVSRSRCPSRVGLRGIVVKDTRFTFEIVTKRDKVSIVPKEGTVFRISVPAEEGEEDAEDRKPFTFEIHGDQFKHRSADRANKKFKAHYLKDL